jgi:hypothetical protein
MLVTYYSFRFKKHFNFMAQGTLSPVSPLAYGTEGLRAYGTGDSVPHRGKPL